MTIKMIIRNSNSRKNCIIFFSFNLNDNFHLFMFIYFSSFLFFVFYIYLFLFFICILTISPSSFYISYFYFVSASEEKKQKEQNIKFENMDYTLKNVYDTKLFQNQIFRINKIVEDSQEYSQEYSQGNSQEHSSKYSSQSNEEKNSNDEEKKSQNLGFLRIRIPIAVVDGDFRMQPGTAKIKGRASETEVQILQYGYYQV